VIALPGNRRTCESADPGTRYHHLMGGQVGLRMVMYVLAMSKRAAAVTPDGQPAIGSMKDRPITSMIEVLPRFASRHG
jgi:hypothetical protein